MNLNSTSQDNEKERSTLRKHLISEHGITPTLSESYEKMTILHNEDHANNPNSHKKESREFELDKLLDYLANKY